MRPVAVIGVPTNSSGLTTGVALAPTALRAAGLIELLRSDSDVLDLGDVAIDPPSAVRDPLSGIIDPRGTETMILRLRDRIAHAHALGRFPLVIGGDCPLLLGCLAAAKAHYGRIGMLFVDGHEDAWPPQQSTTGEAADMEFGLALAVTAAPTLQTFTALLPLLQANDVWLFGPRDAEEVQAAGAPLLMDNPALARALHYYDDRALQSVDLTALTHEAVASLAADPGAWWLHLDLDVLSTEALSAVDYQQVGGVAWEQLDLIVSGAFRAPGVIGCDITIYNPDLDPDRRHAARIVSFLGAAMHNLAE